MKKRAQLTVFIIIAIFIIAIIISLFYFKSSVNKKELNKEYFISNNIKPSLKNIQDFSIDCLKETSINALETIGVQGGYFNKPEKYYDLKWAFIPYYFYRGEILMPSREKVQNELSEYVNNNFPKCIDELNENFKTFKITYTQPSTSSVIEENKVIFTTDLELTIDNEGKTTLFSLKKHPVEIESLLYNIYNIAKYITESHNEDEDFICINCLAELSKEKNVYVDFISFEPDSTLIMIIENQTQPEPYVFQFLNKYSIQTNLINQTNT